MIIVDTHTHTHKKFEICPSVFPQMQIEKSFPEIRGREALRDAFL